MVKIWNGIKLGMHLPLVMKKSSGSKVTQDQLLEMAHRRYGYGRWDAPFWFIGPEEGMDAAGIGTAELKAEKWLEMGSPEVCDCREFHRRIGVTEFHEKEPGPSLQRTWKPLMLLLMTVLGRTKQDDEVQMLNGARLSQVPRLEKCLRCYQRERWGTAGGETCVIELSAFPAKGFAFPVAEKHLTKNQIFEIREERIDFLGKKIKEHSPKLVVMYGLGEESSWKKIAGDPVPEDEIRGFRAGIRKLDSTIAVLTPHPAGTFGLSNAYWVELGKKLRAIPINTGALD